MPRAAAAARRSRARRSDGRRRRRLGLLRGRVHLHPRVSRYRVIDSARLRRRGATGARAAQCATVGAPSAMKLIIQIPCFNEEAQLPVTLADLPREVDGFDAVEWLIIDDGSTDRTIEVARAHGVDHIVRLTNNKGLAAGFQAGLDAGLKLGADVIVNTDADNQYEGADIPKLVAPILARRGRHGRRRPPGRRRSSTSRAPRSCCSGSAPGSCARPPRPRSPTPPRASAPTTARRRCRCRSSSKFTYTLETIIQAGKLLVAVDHVPIRTNPKTRESRLFPSMAAYVRRNALSIFRIYSQYEPLQVFWGARGGDGGSPRWRSSSAS